MVIHTERLALRPWCEADAANLFAYASDPDVGPAAGWPPHRSIEESREVIRTVFSAPYTFAVCLVGTDEPIGSIGLMPFRCESSCQGVGLELEVGYWIAKPFWDEASPQKPCGPCSTMHLKRLAARRFGADTMRAMTSRCAFSKNAGSRRITSSTTCPASS